jgi:hypothetical protein
VVTVEVEPVVEPTPEAAHPTVVVVVVVVAPRDSPVLLVSVETVLNLPSPEPLLTTVVVVVVDLQLRARVPIFALSTHLQTLED